MGSFSYGNAEAQRFAGLDLEPQSENFVDLGLHPLTGESSACAAVDLIDHAGQQSAA